MKVEAKLSREQSGLMGGGVKGVVEAIYSYVCPITWLLWSESASGFLFK